MEIFPKFSFSPFCHFSPRQKVFLPYRQKLGYYRGFYPIGEKPANPVAKQYKKLYHSHYKIGHERYQMTQHWQ